MGGDGSPRSGVTDPRMRGLRLRKQRENVLYLTVRYMRYMRYSEVQSEVQNIMFTYKDLGCHKKKQNFN